MRERLLHPHPIRRRRRPRRDELHPAERGNQCTDINSLPLPNGLQALVVRRGDYLVPTAHNTREDDDDD